ncbi:class I SAM-dependent methyltransferase [Deminuibacter soli]|uniref:Class I SAM-dependent methyltransferase n=1 Tax=Deminuibacter soli TaxID=2291815 RepID=A0A3E1NHY3_9BACT|nr:class I SAM-dependent methyltransferase [Deminuibacter soli]RFM27553.1 class I SAM-dependent methyltransferase [Deminuibacter soli]
MSAEISKQFNEVAQQYDQQRRFLIPCFNDFYHAALPLLQHRGADTSVLDIGAGTGLFSAILYQQHPAWQYTLLDVSVDMLQVAKKRFHGLDNFSFTEADFSGESLSGSYDVVISALAIHHLEDAAKITLYNNIYQILKPGGIFINADQVQGRSPLFDAHYKTRWRETVINSGLDKAAIDKAFERIKLDKFAPLEWQLQTLEQAGFTEVDCIYKNGNFVVFAGCKGK